MNGIIFEEGGIGAAAAGTNVPDRDSHKQTSIQMELQLKTAQAEPEALLFYMQMDIAAGNIRLIQSETDWTVKYGSDLCKASAEGHFQ